MDVVSVQPEAGDPNDFIVRIVPPQGEGPQGYLDLAERFFGPVLAGLADEDALSGQRERAQRELAAALEHWAAVRAGGKRLLVRLPFAIPGDGGVESMWLEVTRYDPHTITGTLVDEPLAATDLARGDEVTMPRTQVEGVVTR
jgi:hypothetical protein